VLKKTAGHYPAPLAAIEAVHDGYAHGREAGFRQEARRFGELAVSEVSRELVYLFHATTALKKDDAAFAGAEPRPVRQLAVVGAGFMGSGIAALAARRGTPVRLKDGDLARVARGLDAVRNTLRDAVRRRRATALEVAQQQALVTGTADYSGFRRADLVVEAVFEDLALKRRVLEDVERAAPHAVLASNTSTIPVAEIAEGVRRPDRVVGMHFFSPVARMPLLEVVRAARSAPEALATAVAYGRHLGKTVIVVGDGPGFYVNRILAPYLNEAGWLLDAGVPVERVDAAMVAWGFPVGPFQLMDEVGFDVAAKAGQVVADAFGDRLAPAPGLQRVLESGRLGRKGGQGFYKYEANGRRGAVDGSVYAVAGVRPLSGAALGPEQATAGGPAGLHGAAQIVERAVYPMLDEAVRCLDDGVIHSPRDGDVGAVFGIGYPAFRGGPFRTLDALGPAAVVEALDRLSQAHPGRFAPSTGLTAMASEGARAHPRAE
jgi:3-hydroxyacyl-CoA dehydrogenase/enoyl-CoA hydratase/3-hydroxybutyryl-CoA epimerase